MKTRTTLEGLDIVCFGARPWGAQLGTAEQILGRLYRTNRVVDFGRT